MQKTSGNKVADHLAPAHGRALGAAYRGRIDDARLNLTFHGKSHHRGRVRYRAPDYDAWTPQRLLIILRPGGDGQVVERRPRSRAWAHGFRGASGTPPVAAPSKG